MKRWLTNSFLLVVVLLAGAELVARTLYSRSLSGRFEYGYNLNDGFEEKGGNIELIRTGGRKFRPQSFTKTPPAGTYRVMVVGDSVARGPTLEEAYPAVVAEELKKAGLKAESWNLALGGYGARRKQIVLQKALEYQPSLIILHVNTSNEYEDEREYKRSQEFKGWHPKTWLMKSLIIRRIYEAKTEGVYWKWLPQEIRAQNAVSDADAEVTASLDDKKQAEWLARVKQSTAECVALARAKGVPIVLVAQAYHQKEAGGKSHLDDVGLEALLQPLQGPGCTIVSMKGILQNTDFKQLYADTSHLRAPGHKVLGAAIVEQMRREGMVK
jgi:hypothetical protein